MIPRRISGRMNQISNNYNKYIQCTRRSRTMHDNYNNNNNKIKSSKVKLIIPEVYVQFKHSPQSRVRFSTTASVVVAVRVEDRLPARAAGSPHSAAAGGCWAVAGRLAAVAAADSHPWPSSAGTLPVCVCVFVQKEGGSKQGQTRQSSFCRKMSFLGWDRWDSNP